MAVLETQSSYNVFLVSFVSGMVKRKGVIAFVLNCFSFFVSTSLYSVVFVSYNRQNIPEYAQWLKIWGNYLWHSMNFVLVMLRYIKTPYLIIKKTQSYVHLDWNIAGIIFFYFFATLVLASRVW